MPALLDRLRELAMSDHVTVVLALDIRGRHDGGGSIGLAALLRRAAMVPDLDVWVFPDDSADPADVPALEFDLDRLTSAEAEHRIASVLAAVESGAYRCALVQLGSVMARDDRRPPLTERAAAGTETRRRLVVVDRPGWSDQLRASATTGLAVAGADVDPSPTYRANELGEALSAVEALVALRSHACNSSPSAITC